MEISQFITNLFFDKNKLKNCEIKDFVDKDTGQYKVDWASDLEWYESCIQDRRRMSAMSTMFV